MGKRSDFDRVPRDLYPTPYKAVLPLLPHLDSGSEFDEPCAGNGALITHLQQHGHYCAHASDIMPQTPIADGLPRIHTDDALAIKACASRQFITNPPWSRPILHPLIERLSDIAPTWLLIDADWMHTRQAGEFMPLLRKVVSIGRLKWIPDSKMTGKDNAIWALFDANGEGPAQFYGRAK